MLAHKTITVPTSPQQWEACLHSPEVQTREDCRMLCRKPHLQRLLELLPDGSLILEAGWGLGQFVYAFASLGHRCVGLDFSARLLERADVRGRDLSDLQKLIRWKQGSILELPIESETLDCYVSFGVLEHFTKASQRAVLSEAHRVLKPGGLIYQYVPNFWSPWTVRRQLRYWFRKIIPHSIVRQRNMSRSQIRKRCLEAGFVEIYLKSFYASAAMNSFALPARLHPAVPRALRRVVCRSKDRIGRWCDSRDLFGYGLVYIGSKTG